MNVYSQFTITYVNDICDSLNEGIESGQLNGRSPIPKFFPENYSDLTTFLRDIVICPIAINSYLEEKKLVNRGRCPYTGTQITNSSPKWTFMRVRSIYLSPEGMDMMRSESGEEVTLGQKAKGCYIASVCYNDQLAGEVYVLRKYRDSILSKSISGKLFIRFYYFVAPSIAKLLQNRTVLNNSIKKNFLDKMVRSLINNQFDTLK